MLTIRSILIITSLLISSSIDAHESAETLPTTQVTAKVAISYRNESLVEPGEAWLIPGMNLGGEALPVEKGFSLDDAQILADYRVEDNYAISAKFSAHGHHESIELELENLWFTWLVEPVSENLLIEVGILRTEITDTAYYHASESEFSEAPLLSDAFFGRHFNDTGIKAKWQKPLFSIGAEVWSGSSWPASGDEGGLSGFIKFHPNWQGFHIDSSFWAMAMNVENRNDDRYGSDHSHGGLTVTSPAANIFFTGDTLGLGTNIDVGYQAETWQIYAQAEWIQFEHDGDLFDSSGQNSALDSTYEGLRYLLGLEWHNHLIAVQTETLTLENVFFDSVNVLFLEQSGLLNNGFDPAKHSVSWQWSFAEDFKLRTEWIIDESYIEDNTGHFSIGLVWSRGLFN
ncbi:MAG: hypothetical protein AAGB12_11860 [Pseudomonadota bacterium]